MSAAQKTGWDEFGEYHGPFTEVTTFPCPVPGGCPCARPCEMAAKVLVRYEPFDPEAFLKSQPIGGAA